MLVLPNRLLCWAVSTSDQDFVSSQPVRSNPHTQIRRIFSNGVRKDIPIVLGGFFHDFSVFLTTFSPNHWPAPLLAQTASWTFFYQTVLCLNLSEPSLTPKKPWIMELLFGTICCSCLVFLWGKLAQDHPVQDLPVASKIRALPRLPSAGPSSPDSQPSAEPPKFRSFFPSPTPLDFRKKTMTNFCKFCLYPEKRSLEHNRTKFHGKTLPLPPSGPTPLGPHCFWVVVCGVCCLCSCCGLLLPLFLACCCFWAADCRTSLPLTFVEMSIQFFSNQLRQICRDPIEFQRGSLLPPTTATTLGAPHRKTHPCRFRPSKMCVLLLLLLVLFFLFLTAAAWCWFLCAVCLAVRVAFAAALAVCCCFCCCCLFCCLCCCAVSKCAAACANLLLLVVCVLPVLLFLLFFLLLLRCWDADRWKTHPCRFWLYNWSPLHCLQKKKTGISKKKLEKPKNSLLLLLFVLPFSCQCCSCCFCCCFSDPLDAFFLCRCWLVLFVVCATLRLLLFVISVVFAALFVCAAASAAAFWVADRWPHPCRYWPSKMSRTIKQFIKPLWPPKMLKKNCIQEKKASQKRLLYP